MPTIDMPTQSDVGGGSKQGFGTGLPTPVLLAAVGGGIGLVVFMMRRSGTPSSSQGGSTSNTLLPNTAIMLGSLQQGILQLQGDVTQGNADLSSQLTGVGETIGTQIDVQSGQWQQAFAALNTYLGGNFDNLAASESALSTAIAGLGTQNAGLADSLTSVLNQLYGVNTGLQGLSGQITGVGQGITAGLGSLGSQITGVSGQIQDNQSGLALVAGGINSILQGQTQLQGSVNQLGQQISQIPLNQFADGTYVKAWSPSQQIYGIGIVQGGVLHKFSTWSQYIGSGGSGSLADLNNMPTIDINTYNAEGTVYTGH